MLQRKSRHASGVHAGIALLIVVEPRRCSGEEIPDAILDPQLETKQPIEALDVVGGTVTPEDEERVGDRKDVVEKVGHGREEVEDDVVVRTDEFVR